MYTQTTTESLTFVMEGFEQALSFRAKVTVDSEDIIEISWHEKFNEWPHMQIRMPGSYLPSWVMAGSYWNDEGWDFVYARKPKGLMLPMLFDVLEVKTKQQRYKRIIIQMSKEEAEKIVDWWKDTKS